MMMPVGSRRTHVLVIPCWAYESTALKLGLKNGTL